MRSLFKAFDKCEKYALVILMAMMTFCIITQVISRTVFKNSLSWTEELARYMLVWITLIGASHGISKAAHMGVEVFVNLFKEKNRVIIKSLVLVLCMIFTSVVFFESIKIIQLQMLTKQVSAAVQIPMWIPYLGITIGSFMMTIRFFEQLLIVLSGEKAEVK